MLPTHEPMHEHDLSLLKTLVLVHGLAETVAGLSAIACEISLELADTDAHRANDMMHASVVLDEMYSELEFENQCTAALTG